MKQHTRVANKKLLLIFIICISLFFGFKNWTHNSTLFYKLDKPGYPSFYIMGTIHLGDPEFMNLTDEIKSAMAKSSNIIMEMDLSKIGAMDGFLFLAKKSIREVLGDTLYTECESEILKFGLSLKSLNPLKIWAATMLLTMSNKQQKNWVDEVINKKAVEMGIPVIGLETLQEQVALFTKIPLREHIADFTNTIFHFAEIQKDLYLLMEAYKKGSIFQIYQEILKKSSPQFSNIILKERNRMWVKKLLPIIQKNPCFMAVGAGHLDGPEGLLELFKNEGFQLIPVP